MTTIPLIRNPLCVFVDRTFVLEKGGLTDRRLIENCPFLSISHTQICAGHKTQRNNLAMARDIAQRAASGSAQAMESTVSHWAWEVVS